MLQQAVALPAHRALPEGSSLPATDGKGRAPMQRLHCASRPVKARSDMHSKLTTRSHAQCVQQCQPPLEGKVGCLLATLVK